MTGIVEFLTARLDEDEAAAKEHLDKVALAIYNSATAHPRRKPCEDFATLPLLVQERYRALVLESQPAPARVLAEVKAKRAIVALHGLETLSHQPAPYELPEGFAGEFVGYCQPCSDLDYPEGLDTYYEPWPCPSMRILASIYDQHPDYKQEWGVE